MRVVYEEVRGGGWLCLHATCVPCRLSPSLRLIRKTLRSSERVVHVHFAAIGSYSSYKIHLYLYYCLTMLQQHYFHNTYGITVLSSNVIRKAYFGSKLWGNTAEVAVVSCVVVDAHEETEPAPVAVDVTRHRHL